MTMMSVSGWMFLLVPAHPGCPGQIPQSRKTVVCVCMCVYWKWTISNAVNHSTICPSVCLMLPAQNGAFYGYGYCRTLIGKTCCKLNPLVSVVVRIRRGRNSNKAVASATSEPFARWLHHWIGPSCSICRALPHWTATGGEHIVSLPSRQLLLWCTVL